MTTFDTIVMAGALYLFVAGMVGLHQWLTAQEQWRDARRHHLRMMWLAPVWPLMLLWGLVVKMPRALVRSFREAWL